MNDQVKPTSLVRSPKFWIPFVVSLFVQGVFLFYVLSNLGFPSKPGQDNKSLANIIFPYLYFFGDGLFALMGESELFIMIAIGSILIQIPIYGAVFGYGLYKRKLLLTLGILIGMHFLVYFAARFLSE